ncbi:MAG: hypothetical protein PWP03_63 [Candidatus Woesearchaeota archaeon]|nr:hypothetical protein [Candidatus Woesearchaeota archaeon]MDN5327425.1 hypothetical protein [Candidatus Woesearchaeota archaeon]
MKAKLGYIEKLDLAKKSLETADHILYVSYPLIKEPKLLLSAVESLYKCLEAAMEALLEFEYFYKRIPYYGNSFDSKFYMFKTQVSARYHIDRNFLLIFSELREILDWHNKTTLELRKDDKFMIFLSDYRVKTLTLNKVKEYLTFTKNFIRKIEQIVMRK